MGALSILVYISRETARAERYAKNRPTDLPEIREKGEKRIGGGNEWMAKKVNLRPGIECINVAVGEHLYGELKMGGGMGGES